MNANVTFYFHRKDSVDYLIPFHTHKCYELVYYYSGTGHCFIDGKKYNYQKWSYVVIPPDAVHNDIHETDCELTCLGFTLERQIDFLPPIGSFADSDGLIREYLQPIDREFREKRRDFMSIINNLLSNILVEISRNSLDFSDKSANHKEVVEQAVNYINEYFLTEITPIQLAELTNYSYHHFRHIFKKILGMPPQQYIIRKRLDYAKRLLATTNLSVTEISYRCQFSSTSQFIQLFRKATGLTPAKYRQQLHSDEFFSSGQSIYE